MFWKRSIYIWLTLKMKHIKTRRITNGLHDIEHGLKMPMEGFGVFQVPEAAVCEQAVTDALAVGYRLIDTAAAYFNDVIFCRYAA